jgi:ABC-2 type transport system ATP-binding protein
LARKNILITGGAGFIGSHLADELLKRGHRVRALDSLVPQVHGSGAQRPDYLDPEVELRVGDVRDADAVRARVSLTGQYASVDEDLTGQENLYLLARLLGHRRRAARDRAGRLLEVFGLAEAADRLVKYYSGGMRRRLDIAASIINTPELLFLDEPTTGLDPRSRIQVWDIVRAVVGHGTTVLLTTQHLDEADHLAGRIAVVDNGRVIAEGTPGELKASVGAGAVHVRLRDPGRRALAAEVLERTLAGTVQLDADPVALTARVQGIGDDDLGAAEHASRALAELTRAGVIVDDFSLGQPSLDEVFLTLTGAPAEPPGRPPESGAEAKTRTQAGAGTGAEGG